MSSKRTRTRNGIATLSAIVLASSLAAGCAPNRPANSGSCPTKTVEGAIRLSNVGLSIDDTTTSPYDKSDKDVLMSQRERVRDSTVLIRSQTDYVDEETGQRGTMSWHGSGTAWIHPETKEEYVVTAPFVLIPHPRYLVGKKFVENTWKLMVNEYPAVPAIFSGLMTVGLIHVPGCPDIGGCFKSSTYKVSQNSGAGDYIFGSGHAVTGKDETGEKIFEKTSFYGTVLGTEMIMGLTGKNIKVGIKYGRSHLGSGVFVSHRGETLLSGIIVGQDTNGYLDVLPASSLEHAIKQHPLGKFYTSKKKLESNK